jgi:hypothetical protein
MRGIVPLVLRAAGATSAMHRTRRLGGRRFAFPPTPLGSFADFEREMIRGRTGTGLREARIEGRIPKITAEQKKEIVEAVPSGRKTSGQNRPPVQNPSGNRVADDFAGAPRGVSRAVPVLSVLFRKILRYP